MNALHRNRHYTMNDCCCQCWHWCWVSMLLSTLPLLLLLLSISSSSPPPPLLLLPSSPSLLPLLLSWDDVFDWIKWTFVCGMDFCLLNWYVRVCVRAWQFDAYHCYCYFTFANIKKIKQDMSEYKCENGQKPIFIPHKPVAGVIGASFSVVSIMVANILRLFRVSVHWFYLCAAFIHFWMTRRAATTTNKKDLMLSVNRNKNLQMAVNFPCPFVRNARKHTQYLRQFQ